MTKLTNRGYVPTDEKEFSKEVLTFLRHAGSDLSYLVDRGYNPTHAVTFIGNRFQFSARQRMALLRCVSTSTAAKDRLERQYQGSLCGKTVFIDGFNLIITLEAAQSPNTLLLRGMDGSIRDLCGLHGTYRLIESTQLALLWIGNFLQKKNAEKVIFYLDSPISNSGRLRGAIAHTMESLGIYCEINLVPNADAELWGKECVITSDGIILDRCKSWINGASEIISANLPTRRIVSLF